MARYYDVRDKNKRDKMIAYANKMMSRGWGARTKPYQGMSYGEVGKKIRSNVDEYRNRQRAYSELFGKK